MFVLRTEPGDRLFRDLHYFASFSSIQQQQILYRALNSFLNCSSNKTGRGLDNSLFDDIHRGVPIDLKKIKMVIIHSGNMQVKKLLNMKIHLSSWEDMESFFDKLLQVIDESQPLMVALLCNIKMYESGLCPLLLYSFNKWQWGKGNANQLKRLVEFSLVYLYRFIKVENNLLLEYHQKIDVGGATCHVYFSDKNIVCKSPKNLAAILYILPQEIEIYQILDKSALSIFIPSEYRYDSDCHALYHEFVHGKNGWHYLSDEKNLSIEQIESLKFFYNTYQSLGEEQLILDIHPGNMVWEVKKRQWFLIDLGPLPEIGKEYYEFNTFELYYEEIWLNLEEKMQKYPIRSVDLLFEDDEVVL